MQVSKYAFLYEGGKGLMLSMWTWEKWAFGLTQVVSGVTVYQGNLDLLALLVSMLPHLPSCLATHSSH